MEEFNPPKVIKILGIIGMMIFYIPIFFMVLISMEISVDMYCRLLCIGGIFVLPFIVYSIIHILYLIFGEGFFRGIKKIIEFIVVHILLLLILCGIMLVITIFVGPVVG